MLKPAPYFILFYWKVFSSLQNKKAVSLTAWLTHFLHFSLNLTRILFNYLHTSWICFLNLFSFLLRSFPFLIFFPLVYISICVYLFEFPLSSFLFFLSLYLLLTSVFYTPLCLYISPRLRCYCICCVSCCSCIYSWASLI